MPPVGPDRFARAIAALDADELAALVADVWAARGWETAVDGATVVATGGPHGRTERLACATPNRLGRAAVPDDAVDVVVASRASSRVETAAADRGARFLGPAALRDVLLYAIPRGRAERLFEAHVGQPLVVDAPAGDRFAASVSRPVLGAGVLLVVLAGLVVAGPGGVAGPFAGGGDATTPAGTESAPEPSVTPSPTEPAVTYPPGLGPDGVTDAGALATAHGQSLVGEPFDLLVIHHGSRDLLVHDRRWAFSRQTVARVSPIHWWYRFAGVEVLENGTREVVFDDYADHTYEYRRVAGPGPASYRRGLIPTAAGNGLFVAVSEAYVARYLAAGESRVEPLGSGDDRRFRVVATGEPAHVRGAVSSYRAEAVVEPSGRVSRLTARYTRPVANGTTVTETPAPEGTSYETVVFELVYRDVGGTTLGEPAWYDEARAATNRTEIDLWAVDPQWWSRPEGQRFTEAP